MNTLHLYAFRLGARRARRKSGLLTCWTPIGGLVAALWLIALPAFCQTADEHASHHPGAAPASAAPPPNSRATPAPAGAGMGDMMGKMMAPATTGVAAPASPTVGQSAGGMPGMPASPAASSTAGASGARPGPPSGMAPAAAVGSEAMPAAPPSGGCMGAGCGSATAGTPIYSSLMTLPALTPEKRAEIEALASQQFNEGKERLVTGLDEFKRANQTGDNLAMQLSVGKMHEGLDELGAGIAARRVLLEGKAPRNLALDWFKREMNLGSPIAVLESGTPDGATPFHLFTMGLLITFALAMLIMYFYKMRRAAALFGRITPDPSSPPPGSSPPLAGGPNSSPPAAPAPSTSSSPTAQAPPATASSSGTPPEDAIDNSTLPESKGGRHEAVSKAPISPASPAAYTPSSTDTLSGGISPVRHSGAAEALPVAANWRGKLRIGSIVIETPSVKTLRLLPASNESVLPFTFVPGQFLNAAFWIGGARMNRSYSISSSPTNREYLELTVRREPRGAVSRHIDDLLKVGDEIEAGGPVGRFTFSGTEATSIVMIAGGVGITPMMSITRYLTERSWPGDIFFFYACRAPTDFIFSNEVAALQRANPKLHVVVTMSDPVGADWTGPRGRVTRELITQTVSDITSRRIHLCGPPAMMDSIRAILSELGVPSDQVKTEAFGAVKPAPAPAGTTASQAAPATGPLVTFSKNSKSAKIHVDQTILELSEELAIGIEFSCRIGTCGVCKVRMTSGEVDMEVQDALDADDKSKHIILACQAKPKVDVAVEA